MKQEIVPFNFKAWRVRMGLLPQRAAGALDVSYSFYCKMEKLGEGRKVYAWAAYGLEAYRNVQKERADAHG